MKEKTISQTAPSRDQTPALPVIVSGVLEAYWEAGKSIQWSVYDLSRNSDDGRRTPEGRYAIENGDLLTVFNDHSKGQILWQGEVKLEFQRRSVHNPKFPGKPRDISGYVQTGIDPDAWSQMFRDARPAVLIKKQGSSGL